MPRRSRQGRPVALTAGLALAGLCLVACAPRPAPVSPAREEVWAAIQPMAWRYHIDPMFIYALVAAESNFDAHARNGEARGLMQIKPQAWHTVSDAPYEPAVWDWRRNLETGIDYLAWTRSYLHQKGKFSYPALLAAFHYGLDFAEERGFDPRRLDPPGNPIYRELWRGNLRPVPPPQSQGGGR
ncbi:MAG: transglycosylase SLT domain-containing protein [Opitutaceae bacterium]|nr:transglycosylase SLT domain-containing protein [Opitutaceae bacterium]